MTTLLAILLSLAAAAVLAWIVALLAGDGRSASADVPPLLPPARPLSPLGGAHAAPMGRAQVADRSLVIDPPAARPYVSKHHDDTVDVASSLYRPAFAAQVGISPASGQEAHR